LYVLNRGAQVGAQTAACGDATLSQQEKNSSGVVAAGEEHSADEQKNWVNVTSFICIKARYPSRRCTSEELETWP
jgi:hypothetical protein